MGNFKKIEIKQYTNWYRAAILKEATPYISEIQPLIYDIGRGVKNIPHVKEVYVFGSFVNKNQYPEYRMKDLDIVAVVDLTSSEMRSCVSGDFFSLDECEEAIEFTDTFVDSFRNFNLDPWVITADGQLLHWGPLIDEDDSFAEAINIAWEMAYGETGVDIQEFGFSNPKEITEEALEEIDDEDVREQLENFKASFDEEFDRIVDNEYNDGSLGWYSFGEDLPAEYIYQNGLKIA